MGLFIWKWWLNLLQFFFNWFVCTSLWTHFISKWVYSFCCLHLSASVWKVYLSRGLTSNKFEYVMKSLLLLFIIIYEKGIWQKVLHSDSYIISLQSLFARARLPWCETSLKRSGVRQPRPLLRYKLVRPVADGESRKDLRQVSRTSISVYEEEKEKRRWIAEKLFESLLDNNSWNWRRAANGEFVASTLIENTDRRRV